jgi:hypothetical protein
MIGIGRTATRQGIIGRAIGHRSHSGHCTNGDAGTDRIIAPAVPIAAPVIVDIDIASVDVAGIDPVAAAADSTALARTLARSPGATDTAYTSNTSGTSRTSYTAGTTDAADAAYTAGTSGTTNATSTADAANTAGASGTTNATGATGASRTLRGTPGAPCAATAWTLHAGRWHG